MDCTQVRDRLTEHALATLPGDERAFVDRHLEWCAGCRKEAAELEAAAASVGLSLAQSDPPPSLEDRVVDRVQLDPRLTEFRSDLIALPGPVLEFLGRNPNADTYQFIVRAVPVTKTVAGI